MSPKVIRCIYVNTKQRKHYSEKALVVIQSEHFILLKNLIYQNYTEILNLETPNNLALKYTKQKLSEVQRKIEKSIIILAECKTSVKLSVTDKTNIHKKSRKDT